MGRLNLVSFFSLFKCFTKLTKFYFFLFIFFHKKVYICLLAILLLATLAVEAGRVKRAPVLGLLDVLLGQGLLAKTHFETLAS